MSASITINFAGGTATSAGVQVALGNCQVAIAPDRGVSVAMASALTNLTVVGAEILIWTALGASFDGQATIGISWASKAEPSVTLNNLQNRPDSAATVTWPTSSGPVVQILSPGDAMTLAGIVDD